MDPPVPAVTQPRVEAAAVSRFNEDYYCNAWLCVLHDGNGSGGEWRVSMHLSDFGAEGSGTQGPLQGAVQYRLCIVKDGETPLPE